MRLLFTIIVVALFASNLGAQNPRPSTLLNIQSGQFQGATPSSKGDRSVIVYITPNFEVTAQTSDGRGIDWSDPVRIDRDPTGSSKRIHQTFVQFGSNDAIYVVWIDDRPRDNEVGGGPSRLFFSRSADGGITWSPEQIIVDRNALNVEMSVSVGTSRDGSDDHLYVLVKQYEGLFLYSSHDGGASFSSLSVPLRGTALNLSVRGSGTTAHLVWVEEIEVDEFRFGEVFYNRTTDGGQSLDFATHPQLDSLPGVGSPQEVQIAMSGNLVAVGFTDFSLFESGGTRRDFLVNTSLDGGDSFGGPVTVGDYVSGIDDAREPQIMISGANIVGIWSDNRNTNYEIFAATSTDAGASWREMPSFGDGWQPQVSNLSSTDPAHRSLALTWSVDEQVRAKISIDDGLSFTPPFLLSDSPGLTSSHRVAFNDLYNNFIVTWGSWDRDSNTDGVYAGGVRPQTVVPMGWVPGPTTVSFEFQGFDNRSCSEAWALISAAPGDSVFPDGRCVGLMLDTAFHVSLQLAAGGIFAGDIGDNGSGSTLACEVTLPDSGSLFAIGIGVDLGSSPIFCDITDVFEIRF